MPEVELNTRIFPRGGGALPLCNVKAKVNRFGHGHSRDWPHAGFIKPEHSPLNLLGKLLYRRQAPWEQRRKTVILLWAIATGMLLGAACVAMILFQNGRR